MPFNAETQKENGSLAELTALWLNRSKKGTPYLSGKLASGEKVVGFARADLQSVLTYKLDEPTVQKDVNPNAPIIKLYIATVE